MTPKSKENKPTGNEKYLDIKKGIEFFKMNNFSQKKLIFIIEVISNNSIEIPNIIKLFINLFIIKTLYLYFMGMRNS
jgi:hypothetical protein